ncbi:TPA: helix-turn-helix transcriptional regulator [Pseudomonas aeruginosa]|nr:helix-turn-helix transcriptional regulator [Pseudomonas aeruginosa]HBO9140672.1 helix-turn-helix transcriptional regulator [Pseudomonas aeruginosa]HBP5061259.1 helix-turn-helix transcriptional regulator [Pseudomonas aeruginosa]
MTTATITAHGLVGHLGRGAAPRELECLLAVAAGKSSKEAARVLGIAAGTIDKRLLALSTKLHVTRRAAMVAEAFKRGILTHAVFALATLVCFHSITNDDPTLRNRRGGERRVEVRVVARRLESSHTV